jgi:hypothetical protein
VSIGSSYLPTQLLHADTEEIFSIDGVKKKKYQEQEWTKFPSDPSISFAQDPVKVKIFQSQLNDAKMFEVILHIKENWQ